MLLRLFTEQELSQYNGKGGAPTYIAYQYKVYDVTLSFLWKRGRHQAAHLGGKDLTAELKDAPHGHDLLERYPVIGILVKSEEGCR